MGLSGFNRQRRNAQAAEVRESAPAAEAAPAPEPKPEASPAPQQPQRHEGHGRRGR